MNRFTQRLCAVLALLLFCGTIGHVVQVHGRRGGSHVGRYMGIRSGGTVPGGGGGGSGWTSFAQTAGDVICYVSTSGNDSNNCLTTGAPKATFSSAYSAMRDGHADWMLLKRGDVFDQGNFPTWDKGGRTGQPMRVGAYGSGARPVVITTAGGFGIWIVDTCNHFAITDLEMYAHGRDPSKGDYNTTDAGTVGSVGVRIYNGPNDVLVEGMDVHHYSGNIAAQGSSVAVTNVTIRRNVIRDAHDITAPCSGENHAEGLFGAYFNTLLVEENLLDSNGWEATGTVTCSRSSIFNHNIYVSYGPSAGVPSTNLTVRKNISSYAASMCLKMKSEFTDNFQNTLIENNVMYACPIAISAGGLIPAGELMYTGMTIQHNVISTLHRQSDFATDYPSDQHQGIDFVSGTTASITQNTLLDTSSGSSDYGIRIQNQLMSGISVTNNYYRGWSAAPMLSKGTSSGVTVSGNVTSGTGSTDVTGSYSYTDNSRTLNTYATSLGYANFDALITAARGENSNSWNDAIHGQAVVTWIEAGLR